MNSTSPKKPKENLNAGDDRTQKRSLLRNTAVWVRKVAAARRIGSRKKLSSSGDADKVGRTSLKTGPSNDNSPMSNMFVGITEVSGGQFIMAENVNNDVKHNGAEVAFEHLLERVAPAAFHNSAQRVDPPRCHPHTREEILKQIYEWITQSEAREKWLLWLNGAAGAGKSAIMQSLAEKCALSAMAIASFFFFRGDSTRNTMIPFIATLVYQLIRAIPEIKDDILIAIEHDRLIFDQSLESQLQLLIIQPLLRLPRELQRLFVVFIDGLDECGDRFHQSNLIKVLGDVSCRKNIPVVFLIASRREYQIEAGFGLDSIADLLTTIPLDNLDIDKTSDDIRRFITDKFKEIKKTHLHRGILPPKWPPISAVDEIVAKSSGQFIFASVVINYISSPRNNPARQLELVRYIRLREASSQNPFAHLDALYQHIFSQVKALDKVLDVLAFALLTNWVNVRAYERVFQLAHGELEILLVDLSAIIECEAHPNKELEMQFGFKARIKFLHASLPDFLQDKTRSGIYYINIKEYRTKLLCMFLERPPPVLPPVLPPILPPTSQEIWLAIYQETSRLIVIGRLFSAVNIKSQDRLYNAIMKFNFTFYSRKMADNIGVRNCYTSILRYLAQQHFDDQGQANHHISNLFAPGYVKFGVDFYDWISEDWAPREGGWTLWRRGHYDRADEPRDSFAQQLWKALWPSAKRGEPGATR